MQKDTLYFLLIAALLICFVILDATPAAPAPEIGPTSAPASEPATVPTETETMPPATETTVPPTTAPPAEASTEAPTEPEGTLSFNTYDITFRENGDSWGVYDGTLPLAHVTFTSDNPAIATFADGIVTAVGSGTTSIHAEYNGETITCIIRNIFEGTDAHLSRSPVTAPPESFDGASTFYNDAAFVGDSVTLKLSYYAADTGLLGNARFLVRGSYSVGHAVNGTMLMTYQNQEMSLEDALAATGAKKVFFMLGMNDIGYYGIDKTMENWGTLISRVRNKIPGIEIYIQSMTPIWTGGEKGGLTNPNIDSYNAKLKAFAESNSCTYIDVASYMKDATNGLATEYCSDNYVHLTNAGADAWIKVLKNFAGY